MEVKFTAEDWEAYIRLFVKSNEPIRFQTHTDAKKIYEKFNYKLKKAYKLDKNLIYRRK